jgi:hypothetical protein
MDIFKEFLGSEAAVKFVASLLPADNEEELKKLKKYESMMTTCLENMMSCKDPEEYAKQKFLYEEAKGLFVYLTQKRDTHMARAQNFIQEMDGNFLEKLMSKSADKPAENSVPTEKPVAT